MTNHGVADAPAVTPMRPHDAPPAPLWSRPESAGRVDADGYVWGSPSSSYVVGAGQRRHSDRVAFLSPFASRVALGLSVALFAWFALLTVSSLWLWLDSDPSRAALGEAAVGYGICTVVTAVGIVVPGRWRAVFTAAVALFGAALPFFLARGLFDTVGVRDVWVGQSLTFGVLYPLVVGGGATVALWRGSR